MIWRGVIEREREWGYGEMRVEVYKETSARQQQQKEPGRDRNCKRYDVAEAEMKNEKKQRAKGTLKE